MATGIARVLNIEHRERGIVFLLLTQSVFLGIFAGALDVGANSLFLESYGANLMPRAFMFSGIVGIVFTSLYAYLQKRVPFKIFTFFTLLLVLVFTVLLRVGYAVNSEDPRLSFALLVMMGPLILVSLLSFWGTAGRYFTLREGKRLFGIIDTGAVLGMILAFYAVPVLVRFRFEVHDTLLMGIAGMVVAIILQLLTLRRYRFLEVGSEKVVQFRRRSGLFQVLGKRYTRLMVFFVALSVITGFFIHYLFVSVTEIRYPESLELTGFLGAFFGTMMVFTIIIKGTLYGWLMKNYGLRVALLISPSLLFLLIVLASVTGGFFEYGAEARSFTFFFLVIALSKLFNKSLKDAIESPSMKILYQSLDSSERYDVQARIDGTINELTAFVTGLVMAGLILLSFIEVIHFAYILVIILILWAWLGFRLYGAYRNRLNESLAEARMSAETDGKVETEVDVADWDENTTMKELALDPYFLSEASNERIAALLCSKHKPVQLLTWKLIENVVVIFSREQIKKIGEASIHPETVESFRRYSGWIDARPKDLHAAFRSSDAEDRISAIYYTVRTGDAAQVPHLITLLRDRSLRVRSMAIDAAGKLRLKELCTYLVDYLDHPELGEVTWRSLVSTGEPALDTLENAFHKSGVSANVQLRIVAAMRTVGGEQAQDLLFRKCNYHHRHIRRSAIEGLYRSGFRAAERQLVTLKDLLYETVHACAWTLAAEHVFRENDPENGLLEAVMEEREALENLVFMILGIAYDRSVIDHIRDSLVNRDSDDGGFALELMNLVVDEDVYRYLEPYFDEIAITEKIRRLQAEMPVSILSYEALLKEMMGRDALYLGMYTRVCALDAIGRTDDVDATQQLAAQVFHPHEAVRDTATAALFVRNPSAYSRVSERFRPTLEERLDPSEIRAISANNRFLAWTRHLKNRPIFREVSLEALFRLSSDLEKPDGADDSNVEQLLLAITPSGEEEPTGGGVIFLPGDAGGNSERIRGIATLEGHSTYSIGINAFREILFYEKELLDAVRKSIRSAGEDRTLTKTDNRTN